MIYSYDVPVHFYVRKFVCYTALWLRYNQSITRSFCQYDTRFCIHVIYTQYYKEHFILLIRL